MDPTAVEPTLIQNIMSGNIPVGAILGLLGAWGVWKVGSKGAGLLAQTCAKFSVGCVMACVMILAGLAGTGYSIGELVAQPEDPAAANAADAEEASAQFDIDHLSKDDLLNVAKTTGDPDRAIDSIIKYLKFQEDQNRRIASDRKSGEKETQQVSHRVVKAGGQQFILINTGAEEAVVPSDDVEPADLNEAPLDLDLLTLESGSPETPQKQPWLPIQMVWLTMLTSVGLMIGGVTTYFSS